MLPSTKGDALSNRERLRGITAKIQHGKDQLSALDDAIRAFVNSDDFAVTVEGDPDTSQMIVWGEGSTDPPWLDWGIRVGDVIHNWRSALDHLVWELSDIRSGPTPADPIPAGNRWRDVNFPIVTDETKWNSRTGQGLWAIDGRLQAICKGLQPFETRKRHVPPGPADRETLAVLQELWNIDKHRRIHFTEIEISLNRIKLLAVETGAWVPHLFAVKPSPRPFKGKAELARLTVLATEVPKQGLHVEVDWELAYDILFEQGAPGYGAGLLDTLQSIRDTLDGIVIEFEPEFA